MMKLYMYINKRNQTNYNLKVRYSMEDLIQNLYNLDNKVVYSCLKVLEKMSYTSNGVYENFDRFLEHYLKYEDSMQSLIFKDVEKILNSIN